MSDEPTNRELKLMLDNQTGTFTEKLDHQTDKFSEKIDDVMRVSRETRDNVKEIVLQTTKTNGRVTTLEEKTKDYFDLKKAVAMLTNFRWWIVGFAFAFTILSGTVIYLLWQNVQYKIDKVTSILQGYDKIEINNN